MSYLGKGGPSSLGLDGDGLSSALEDLVDVLLAELGSLVLVVHDGPVGPTAQQVLDLFLGELLLDLPLDTHRKTSSKGRTGLRNVSN